MPDALQNLLTGAGIAIGRLRAIDTPAKAAALCKEFGYELPESAFGGALSNVTAQAGALGAAVQTLATASGEAGVAAAVFNVLDKLAASIDAVKQLYEQLRASAPVDGIDEFPRRLTDHLILDYINSAKPDLHNTAHLIGLIEHETNPPAGTPARRINWDRLGRVFTDPISLVNDNYHWDSDFDAAKFLSRLDLVMRALGLRGGFYPMADVTRTALGNTADLTELRMPLLQQGVTPETYSQFGITFAPAEAQGGAKKGLALMPYLMGTSAFDFSVCDRGELVFKASSDLRGLGLVVRPPFDAKGILNLTGAFNAEIAIREKEQTAEEMVLIGAAGGSRLSVQGLGVRWFIAGDPGKLDFGVEGEVRALRLVIAPGEGDGFLQKVLSGVNVHAEASIAAGLSLQSGFVFRGGGQLAFELGVHLDTSAFKVDALRVVLMPSQDSFAAEAGAVLKFDLGPLHAVVENIGLRVELRFEPGNIGPADLGMGFKPPNGVGLSLDAGGFKGGGFLLFDAAKGEYAGALELDFQGLVSVKAVGIISTKLPDGTPGYSLLILISAEFTPIQLSFGFTLNGVGGLIGLNRTISVQALADGLRTNAVGSILFPEDVVANINRIISDLRQFSPPQEGHFIVGPMAKLGWGTPSIITVELGLLLDLPDPMLAIVGVLRAVLPDEDAPILSLQVNFLGVLDFEHGYMFYRADLYNSRLLAYTITGSMAALVSWGGQDTFALSVGGFHPDFRDVPNIPALPDGFRNMARIGLSLLSDDNPRLKIESYFAVTANTVQFGSQVELYAEGMGFNIYGHLGFDVLFQLDPFRFIANLHAGIALREGTSVIAGVTLTGQLTGPSPWDAKGEASLSLLFFDISVSFHVTWGDPPPAIPAQTVDLLGLLKEELADTRNWRADPPPNNHLHVTLRKIEPAEIVDHLVVHPMGVLAFSQRSLPLEDFAIEKFGDAAPLGDTKFKLSNVTTNGAPATANFTDTREQFAPAMYSKLSDSDKLTRRSFEDLPSGFSLTGAANLIAPLPVRRDVEYELSYLHREEQRTSPGGRIKLALAAYNRQVKASAVRQSVLARQQTRPSLNAPLDVNLREEEFVLATKSDLTAHAAADGKAVRFKTQAEAYQRRRELIADNPALAAELQVVSQYELNA